jgi:hypothetical protein
MGAGQSLRGCFDVLLIDGRSGSGKTSLAARIVREFRATGVDPQLLRVEDLYPGWDGLAEGSLAVADVLDRGRYRRYDWYADAFAEAHRIEPRAPLVIEGCGAITIDNLAAARRWASRAAGEGALVRSLWLDCPDELRRSRALARGGESYAPHWDRWAAQEDALYAAHEPWRLADEVLGV